MGLKGTLLANSVDNSYKETISNVYYKIMGVLVDTEKEIVIVPVRGWLSEYARQNKGIGVFKKVISIPIDEFKDTLCVSDELIKKAYEYISQLPEFADCKASLEDYNGPIDVIEEKVEGPRETLEEKIARLGRTAPVEEPALKSKKKKRKE